MTACNCGSYAINIDPEGKVCDVCFYKNKLSKAVEALEKVYPYDYVPRDIVRKALEEITGKEVKQ